MPPMRSSFASSRNSRDAKGRKLKLSQRGDPEKRPILTRIYGMVGCLIVSLALIALLIWLQKRLPSGISSNFHIPERRDLENSVVARQEDTLKEKIPAAPIQRRGRFAPAPTATVDARQLAPIEILTGIHFVTATPPAPTPTGTMCIDGTSMDVECTEIAIIFKKAKRQLEPDTSCYTTILGGCATLPPQGTQCITESNLSIDVECTVIPIIFKKGKRQLIPDTSCYTTTLGACSTTPTPTPTASSDSCMATSTSCITVGNVDAGFETSCGTTSTSIPGCGTTTTPPPSVSSDSCMATSTSCITVGNVDAGFETSCGTTSTSIPGCGITTTPPVSVSTDSCIATDVSCVTTMNDGGSSGLSCSTSFASITGCPATTTPSASVSSDSCIGTTVSCTTTFTDTFCATLSTTIPGCGSTTSSSSPSITTPPITVSSNSCIATDISCTTSIDVELGTVSSCDTSTSTISGCGITTTPSVTVSSNSCIATSISCTTSILPFLEAPVEPIISCNTSFSSISGCGSTTSNSSSTTPTSSPSSSSSTSSPTGSSSSSVPVVVSVSLTTNSSSSSSTTSPTGSSSSSVPVVVSVSVTTNSSSSSSSSTAPLTGPSSSSSSIPLVIVSPTLSSSSIPVSPISTPITGPSSSSSSVPILVVVTPSGPTSSLPSVSVSASSPPVASLSGSSLPAPPVSGSTSLPPATSVPGSPVSVSSVSSGSSVPLPVSGVLKIPSISPTIPPLSPSTLATVPSGSSAPVVSSPTGSETPATPIPSASSGILQSIDATGSLAPTRTAGGGGGGGPAQTDNPTKFHAIPDIWPITQTILGDYTPLVVGRGFHMLLRTFYEQLLTWEPIRQMLCPGGGSLVDSSVLRPIQIAIISAHIGTAFSAGLTFFDTGYCDPAQTNPLTVCPPKLSVTPWVVDVVITTLVIQVLTILYVISQWWKKPGGFSADPTSIAGIAAFMGHPEIEQEFVTLPAEINYAGLKKRLQGKKFRLGQFATERGIVKYGIMPVDDAENDPNKKPGIKDKLGNWWTNLQNRFTWLHSWKKNRFIFDILFVMLLIALLGLTIDAVSRYNKTQVVFLATASANGTGWRIFTALLGVIVSYYWGQIFQDAQTFAPYIDLGRGSSNPDATILLRRHSIPLTAFFPLLWHCHYTPAMIAFIGLIAELLIVALSGLPYRPGQSHGEFLFWGITCLTILTIMIIQLIFLAMWRRKLPHLPRAPESIAAVMTYVAGTSMTRDFNGLEQLKRKDRDQAIRDLEKSYAYWWRREEDGRIRWVVDVVPGDKNNRALMDGASEFS